MKNYILTALLAAGLGGAASHYYWPQLSKSSESESIKNNITTETTEVVKPDGTKEVHTITNDKTVSKSRSAIITAPPKPLWHASISATCDIGQGAHCPTTTWGGQLEYNLIGPAWTGVRVQHREGRDFEVGVTLGVSF